MSMALLHRDWLLAVAACCALGCSSPAEGGARREGAVASTPTAAEAGPAAPALMPPQSPERAELERAVRAIESTAGLAEPAPLTDEELVQVLDYYCGACHFP